MKDRCAVCLPLDDSSICRVVAEVNYREQKVLSWSCIASTGDLHIILHICNNCLSAYISAHATPASEQCWSASDHQP